MSFSFVTTLVEETKQKMMQMGYHPNAGIEVATEALLEVAAERKGAYLATTPNNVVELKEFQNKLK